MNIRLAILLLILAGAGGAWYYFNYLGGGVVSQPSAVGIPQSAPSVSKANALPFDENTKEKIRIFMHGIQVSPKENNLGEAIRLDHSVGRVQMSQGQVNAAYRTYQKVLAISYDQGSLMGIGIALNMLSAILEQNNNRGEALVAALLAYKTALAMKNKEEIGVMELRFARMLQNDDPSSSMVWLLRARKNLKTSRYKEDYVRLLPTLARHLIATKKNEKALEVYNEAWELSKRLNNSPSQKWTKSDVGLAYAQHLIDIKQYAKAEEVLRQTEATFSGPETKTPSYTAVIAYLARVHDLQKGHQKEARQYYQKAYHNYELTRAEALGEEGRASLDREHKGVVDLFISHYLKSKDYMAALALLESNKARTLNDVLGDTQQRNVYRQWVEMEQRQVQERIALLEKADNYLPPMDEGNWSEVHDLYNKQLDERRKLQVALQLKEIAITQGMSKEEVKKIPGRLSPDMAVLSYFVGDERASAFVITRNGLRHIPLDYDAKKHYRTVQQLRVALANPYNDFYFKPAQRLYKQFLAPVVKSLPSTVKILLYSPDGSLSRIPLAALMQGNRFAGEQYAIYRIPSLRYFTSSAKIKAKPVSSGIACVDPKIPNARLPFQHETGLFLKKLYGESSTLLAGERCAESTLMAAINGAAKPTFVHIGAHGNFYPYNVMDSSIWLSPAKGNEQEPQAWTAKSMATLKTNQLNLVTLSSCETGLTDSLAKRDVFGIVRALFFAGTKRIVAPLWSVHDQASAKFMQAFYQAYSQGNSAVLALHHAQNQIRRTEEYSHPYYWSPFVLSGEAR